MNGMTGAQWSAMVCDLIDAPSYTGNLQLITGWAHGENTRARFNPLATTHKMPGSWDFNYNGGYPVQNYQTVRDGLLANAHTLLNGHYPTIVAGLRNASPQQALSAPHEFAVWGTGWANVNSNYQRCKSAWSIWQLWIPPSLVDAPAPHEPDPEPEDNEVAFIITTPDAQFTCNGVQYVASTSTAIKKLHDIGVKGITMTRAELDAAFVQVRK